MKTKALYFICLILMSCNASKNNSAALNSTTQCPDNGTCTTTYHQNKELIIKTDDTGALYYELVAHKNKSVIVYQYKKNTDASLQDSNYSEELIFEIQNNASAINLKDNELQQIKMLYGRNCYCKGQSGYFRVNKGNFSLKNKNKNIKFSLNFKVEEVPQIITSITQKLAINNKE